MSFPVMEGIKVSSLLATLVDAVSIFKDIPEAAAGIAWLKSAIDTLRQKRSDHLDPDSPWAQLVKGESEHLRQLIKAFTEISKRDDFDAVEKEAARKRIATKLCQLLRQFKALLREHVEHYDDLVTIFCDFPKSA